MNPLTLVRYPLSLCLLVLLCLSSPAPARAQDEDEDEAVRERVRASLNVQVDEKGGSRLWLSLGFRPDDPEAVRRRLSEAVGFPLTVDDDIEVERGGEGGEEEESDNWWTAHADDPIAFRRQGLVTAGRLDTARLAEALRPLGVTQLVVNVTFEGKPKNLRVGGAQRFVMPGGLGGLGGLVLPEAQFNLYTATFKTDAAAPVEFSWGYRPSDILWQLTPLFLFLVAPPLLTLRTAWSVARRPQADPADVWGRYFRFLNRTIYFSWLAWLPLYSFAALGELLAAVAGGGVVAVQAATAGLFFGPPLFVIWLCHRLSAGVYRRVGGAEWSPRAVVGRVVASNAAQVAPFFLLLLALDSFGAKRGYAGLFLLGAVVAWVLLSQLAARAYGAVAHAVTRGELRDRVFELAEKAGVGLRQVYVLPDGPAQLSNAFARSDNSVMLTASLLRHLSKREVDAILAHEIGHLKEKHPQAVARLTIGTVIIANVVGTTLTSALGLQRWSAAFLALSLLAASLVAHYLSRGNERHADSIGVNLTRDPEAFITGLARLSRLNLMPLDGGRWGDALDTHPATLRRLRDIAGFGGITPARFEELIAGARAGEAAGARYDASEAAPDRAFSAAFKARWTGRVLWSMVVAILLPPALFALLLEQLVSGGRLQMWGGPFWALQAAGLLLSFGLYHLFRNFASFWGYARLTAQIRARLAHGGRAEAAGAEVCVGLAPGGEERSYENYPFWDAGLLRLSAGRLCYAGEQARFELRREQVEDIYLGDAHAIWLRQKLLYVRWRDDTGGRGGTLQLLPLEGRTLLGCRRETKRLHGRLRGWLAGGPNTHDATHGAAPDPMHGAAHDATQDAMPANAPAGAPAPLPELDAVTGQPMSERTGARVFVRSILMLLWLSFLLSVGVRLTLWGMAYSFAVVAAVCALDQLPRLWARPAPTPAHGGEHGQSPGAPRPYGRGSWAES